MDDRNTKINKVQIDRATKFRTDCAKLCLVASVTSLFFSTTLGIINFELGTGKDELLQISLTISTSLLALGFYLINNEKYIKRILSPALGISLVTGAGLILSPIEPNLLNSIGFSEAEGMHIIHFIATSCIVLLTLKQIIFSLKK